jgi:hypothetical protein
VLTIPESIPAVKRLCVKLDRVLSIASCLIIPALLGGSIVMFVEQAPEQKFVSEGYVWSTSNSFIPVSIPVLVETKSRKALYRIFIRDSQGTIVYVYPDQLLSDPSQFSLINQVVQLPTLKPGQYKVGAELIYWFNPFKNGSVEFQLSNLVINSK